MRGKLTVENGGSFRDHLLSRNYDPDLYINQTIDEENGFLTVHLFNLDHKFIGYQRYNPMGSKRNYPIEDAKYMTYTMKGECAFWGLETLDYSKDTLFIVEGLFKASILHRIGLNSICIMGNNPKPLKSTLLALPFNLVGIGDADEAGMELNKHVEEMDGNSLILDRDVDDYSLDELIGVMKEGGYL